MVIPMTEFMAFLNREGEIMVCVWSQAFGGVIEVAWWNVTGEKLEGAETAYLV